MDVCVKSTGLSFGKALPACKKQGFAKTLNDAKKVLGINNGLSLLKLDSAAFPQTADKDTGIGKLNSQKALDCIKFLTFYTGTKAAKIFPFGQQTKIQDNYYCPYNKTAMTIGEESINLFNLTDKNKYGNILTEEDIKPFVINKEQAEINFENELGTNENYLILKPLKTAFENFKKHLSKPELEIEFENYKKKPIVKENYTRLALYPFLKDIEPDLFINFEKSKKNQTKFKQYQEQFKNEIEFFKFRQFIAEKEHFDAKRKINAEGIKLFGDCLIGFSKQEVWAYPDAFSGSVGWDLPALKAKELLNKKHFLFKQSTANKMFNDKITFYLEHFDGIRFDVGWWYAIARIEKDNIVTEYDFKHRVFDYIEKQAKKIKGRNFDKKNLIYEMDGFPHLFYWNKKPIAPLENIKNIVNVLTTEYEHRRNEFEIDGWGYPAFFKHNGLSEDELIIGTNNHDGENLRILAEAPENETKRKNSIPVLSYVLRIPRKQLEDSKEFIKAKFAELYTTKNQFLFFVDVLGADKNIDDQTTNSKNFRFRIDRDFETQYHTALQEGRGFNIMEALGTVLKSRRLNEEHPDLYKDVLYFANYLRQPGAKTEADANKEFAATI